MFLGNQRSKAAVAWKPPPHSASSGSLRGGSPGRQSSPHYPSLSAEPGFHTGGRSTPPLTRTGGLAVPEGLSSRSANFRSPFADPGSPPAGRGDSEIHVSDSSDRGLQVPEVVKQWVTSQRSMSSSRGMTPQSSSLVDGTADRKGAANEHAGSEDEAEIGEGEKLVSGDFADAVPLDSFRTR